ncbi:MAG: hypothetical protein GF310_00590 [candidate division Zixibacteria bacterium]|nr:hypothetical protein [candidate division Zixibacteria bacterium]
MKSIRPALLALFTLGLLISNLTSGIAQTPGDLTDFWEMETRYTYSISTWNTEVGKSTGTFAGIAKHASVGNKYLFRTETIVRMLNGDISSKISSELFTDSEGYPSFYTAEYIEKKDTTSLTGVISPEGFQFQKLVDTTESSFTVNSSPTTVLCDKQSIPLWNLAFYNEPDLEADTIIFHVIIPYLEKRAVMTMVRKPDSIQTIMGEEINCKVFFSLRTEEYYYITPDHHVALVSLPKQNLRYELVAVEKVEIEEKKEDQAE